MFVCELKTPWSCVWNHCSLRDGDGFFPGLGLGLGSDRFLCHQLRFLPVQLIGPDRVRARPEPHEVSQREAGTSD